MSPPILHPLFPFLEPIKQTFHELFQLKPPPRQVAPEEVSSPSHRHPPTPCHISDPVTPKTKKERPRPIDVAPQRVPTPPPPPPPPPAAGSGEEVVTSPLSPLSRLVLEDALVCKYLFEIYPLQPPIVNFPLPSIFRLYMAPPPRPAASTTPSSSSKSPKSEYISTDTGNKVARRTLLFGTQHIILGGRAVIQPQVCIRGDLTRLPHQTTAPPTTSTTQPQPQPQSIVSVSIGRYSFISSTAVLRPPFKLIRGIITYNTLRIGEHVLVGPGAVIEAAAIGDRAVIGEGSVVGRLAILKEGCMVLPGTVVPGGMVVPSGVVVGGRPARIIGEVGDGWEGEDLKERWRETV